MAPAKKGYSDEHVAKKQKQKQDSFDLGKIAARHLLEGDEEDIIQTFNGFENEEKFGAFDVLNADGMKFDHKGIAKDLFQQIMSGQRQPREAGKRWSEDEEYETFERITPQIVTELRSGVARFTRGPIQMDALLTVCRVSQTNPVGGEESLRENLRICRAVFLKDFQFEADPAWS